MEDSIINNGKANDIEVSVYCLAYNHGKYIRDALEAFVSQETTFKYEVIVHDDASTDNTADIIREYAEKYPDIIKPIFQTENQYSKGIQVTDTYIWPQMRGNYVAICEGDDYWTDSKKLQYQYEIMEQHPECSICTHNTKVMRADDGEISGFFPDKKFNIREGIVSKDTQMNVALFNLFHLTSVFLRRSVYDNYMANKPEFAKVLPAGDKALQLYFAKYGYMYFIDRDMSVYRKGIEGSWTQRIERITEKQIWNAQKSKEAVILCKKFYNGEYSDAFDERIKNYDLHIAELNKDYKTLRKNLIYIIRSPYLGGIKWAAEIMISSVSPKLWGTLIKVFGKIKRRIIR